MRVNWRVEIPQWLIVAGMFVAAAILWPTIPSRVPVHWDASGNVNGYGGKFEALLLMPIITIGIYLLLLFIPRIDPGKANYAQFASMYVVIRYVVLLVMAAIYVFTILAVKGAGFDMTRVIIGVDRGHVHRSGERVWGRFVRTGSSACARPGRCRASAPGCGRIVWQAGSLPCAASSCWHWRSSASARRSSGSC